MHMHLAARLPELKVLWAATRSRTNGQAAKQQATQQLAQTTSTQHSMREMHEPFAHCLPVTLAVTQQRKSPHDASTLPHWATHSTHARCNAAIGFAPNRASQGACVFREVAPATPRGGWCWGRGGVGGGGGVCNVEEDRGRVEGIHFNLRRSIRPKGGSLIHPKGGSLIPPRGGQICQRRLTLPP